MWSGRKYYFLTIAKTLNITRAAEQLMVSQPSLTQYLNKLEQDLGIKLLDRSYTPLRLTLAGKVYQEYLLKQQEADYALEAELNRLRSLDRRPLTIGLPLQKSHEIISKVLPEFARAHPDTDVQIWEGTSSTVRERVMRGELDIGFGHTMDERFEDCQIQRLNREKLLIICHRDDPIVAGRTSSMDNSLRISPELLSAQHFFQMSQEYYLYEVESKHMESYGVRPRSKTIISNLHAIISSILVGPGSGFAYMPDYVLNEPWPSTVRDRLAYLRLGEEDISWHFSMLRKRSRPMSADARSFWDHVMGYVADGPKTAKGEA